ncbi:MAG: sensor histidine kinase [Chthonomonadaceae bacterium]|nr:sensor histidine kinase [Chthonomonadaceae bacterium]
MERIVEGKRLDYTIEEAVLSSKQGTSLSLIVNELILNALKHSGNSVEVKFRVDLDYAILTVTDDGPGLPANFDVKYASNTGLALIENLARWDLQGETGYKNREHSSGAQISVSFPLIPQPETAGNVN